MISGISGLQGYQALARTNAEHQASQAAQAPAAAKDTININPAVNMTDEEAEQTLQEVSQDIVANQAEALNVHQGLDYDRVMALLGDI